MKNVWRERMQVPKLTHLEEKVNKDVCKRNATKLEFVLDKKFNFYDFNLVGRLVERWSD